MAFCKIEKEFAKELLNYLLESLGGKEWVRGASTINNKRILAIEKDIAKLRRIIDEPAVTRRTYSLSPRKPWFIKFDL